MNTAKAFRATLPEIRDHQLQLLQSWSEQHCALSSLFRDERGRTIFLGLVAVPRSSASFARTLRCVLRRLCIDVPLRGRWLQLATAREVLAVVQQGVPPADGRWRPLQNGGAGSLAESTDDEDCRVICLQ